MSLDLRLAQIWNELLVRQLATPDPNGIVHNYKLLSSLLPLGHTGLLRPGGGV